MGQNGQRNCGGCLWGDARTDVTTRRGDKEEDIQDDEPQDKYGKIVNILNVLTIHETHGYESTCNKIFAVMNAMHMKKMRRGALQTRESSNH